MDINRKCAERIGPKSQMIIIISMFFLEWEFGFNYHKNIWLAVICLALLFIFFYEMADLYLREKRNGLKTNGLFKFTRHPVYNILILISLTYWFSMSKNLIGFFILQFGFWFGIVVASFTQEILILDKYKEKAEEYYKKTPRFFFMYPFKKKI